MATTTYVENGLNTPNGSNLAFSYSFPVLKTEDVKVALNGVTQATTKYAVDNTSNPTRITFNNTSIDSDLQESTGAPKTGVVVRVYRDTDVDSAKGVYAAGSSIRAVDLNNNQDQVLYALQEKQNQKGLFESISLDDSRSIKFGNSDDASIYWDGTGDELGHQLIISSGNPIQISTGNNKNVVFKEGNDISFTVGTAITAYVDVKPNADGTIDLGASNKEWKDLYVDGTGYIDTVSGDQAAFSGNLQVGGTISNSGGNLELADNVDISGSLTVDGNVTLGDANTDLIVVNGKINSDLLPNDAYKGLGDAGNTWHYGHIHNLYTYGNTILCDHSSDTLTVKGAADFDHTLNVDGLATLNSITGSAVVTSGTSTSDTKVYSAKRAGEIFYQKDTLGEIQSGETWIADDLKVATTAAIDARIVDLVDDVGGFIPLANELSFPNANPDVNNAYGTLLSVPLTNSYTANVNGQFTIPNGTIGNSNVTIINAEANETYTAGFGLIVETTSLSATTYSFHRYVPKATEVTTVATNISNINAAVSNQTNINSAVSNATNITTVATNISNVNTVAGISADVTAVAGDSADIGACSTNIGSIAAIGSDLANNFENITDYGSITGAVTSTSGTSDISTLAGGSNLTNIATVAGISSNVTTVAGNTTAINNITTNLSAVQNAATNATNAASSATAAASSATSAATSATTATTQATTATTQATTATTQATTATTQATNAATSATSAASSATTATSQASTATTQASNASTSAANALAYKNLALTYRNEASAILTQVESAPYNLADSASTHTAWGDITDTGANAVFTNESSNTLLTMSEGSSTYNYGSIT